MLPNLSRPRVIFDRFYANNPSPTTELNYKTPFELLIAVILSAQSTDKIVNRVTKELFLVADTPRKILALGDGLKEYIRSINYYPTKAKNILLTCLKLVELYREEVPSQRAALESLPGVGRKTANVILNVIFNEPVVAVDTHIFRVANRTQLALGSTPRAVEDGLAKAIPKQYLKQAHHWLVLHGRYVCKARRPLCRGCLIEDLCPKNF